MEYGSCRGEGTSTGLGEETEGEGMWPKVEEEAVIEGMEGEGAGAGAGAGVGAGIMCWDDGVENDFLDCG